jgi:hypothetical protein
MSGIELNREFRTELLLPIWDEGFVLSEKITGQQVKANGLTFLPPPNIAPA